MDLGVRGRAGRSRVSDDDGGEDDDDGAKLDSLEDTLDGHDSLDEQGLGVVHVPVQESHKGDSLFEQRRDGEEIRVDMLAWAFSSEVGR